MDEEEIETPMEEEGTQRRMYEEYRGAIPFYYRGWAIVTLALISMKLPLLWVAVIYLIIMRNLKIIDYFDALEVSIKEAVQESNDLYVDAMTKAKEAEGYFVEATEMAEEAKRNIDKAANQLTMREAQQFLEEEEITRQLELRRRLVAAYDSGWEERRLQKEKELEIVLEQKRVDAVRALQQEKEALELAVKELQDTHERLKTLA